MIPTTPFNIFDAPLVGINLIEASAGTGKTWNICGLYLRLLLERKLNVQQILVVTFTNAATAELRSRIRTRLVDALQHLSEPSIGSADPFVPELIRTLIEKRKFSFDELRQRIESALLNFDEASIFTIHSFCQRALADSAFAAGQAFSQELMPDDSDLRLEVVRDFWRTHIANNHLGVDLAAYLIQQKDSPENFATLLKQRLAKPLAQYWWPASEVKAINKQALLNAYTYVKTEWQAQRDQVLDLLSDSLNSLNKNSYKEKSILAAAADYDHLFYANNPLDGKVEGSKLHLFRSSILKDRTTGKNITPQHPFFDLAEVMLAERETLEQSLALARLDIIHKFIEETPDAIRRRKRERRLLSFDDLLHNLHDALTGDEFPWLTDTLRQRYPAALVDEFQDTDPQQYEIFSTIYNGQDNTLFMVGDPKQAIYRFRNADLNTYLLARNSAKHIFTIKDNQRSTKELIGAVNHLFQANPRAFMLPGLEYVNVGVGVKRPKPFVDRSSSADDAPLSLWQLPNTEDGHITRNDAFRRATNATASEIARLLNASNNGDTTIDGQPLQASHIAVLVRTHRQGNAIKKALAALNVGSVELSQISVFASIDAREIERVLSAIWTPARIPLLRAALATELIGTDANAIFQISEDELKLMPYVQRFTEYRKTWLQHGISFVFRQLMSDEKVSSRMLCRPDGERRLTNLLHLSELLHQAGEMHPSPDALLRWLQTQRREASSDEAAQLRLESDRNLVQILTIHKSKGLEFPVVFCPFLWDGYRQPDRQSDSFEYHDDDGGTLVDFRLESRRNDAITARIRDESKAEDLRLMYVAFTRAIYRCYLVTGCYLSNKVTNQSKSSLLNWLAAGRDLSPDEWAKGMRKTMNAPDIEKEWASLAKKSGGGICLIPLPNEKTLSLHTDTPPVESLRCLPPPPPIPFGWRISSFSGLSRGATHENAAGDYDLSLHDLNQENKDAAIALDDNDILNFPKGSNAGLCIHKAFELCDFSNSGSWQGAINVALSEYPQEKVIKAERLPSMMTRMMDDVINTSLADGIMLRDVTPDKRLNELGFYLPSSSLSQHHLNQTLKLNGYDLPQLHFTDMECYLKGFIDLVFEHKGRYYILDWKSNHLGKSVGDYDSLNVQEAMGENAYHLQYLLYTLALNRYLAKRIPHYRYETHFGGVLYLFVRGVRPDWKNADGSASGVYFERPARETIDALDALFTSRQSGAA